MPAKLIAGCLLTMLCYAGGREYVLILKGRMKTAEAYGRFAENLASAVTFSRKSVHTYCGSARNLPGLGEWIRQHPEEPLSSACASFRPENDTEKLCAERMKEALLLSESSSDAEHIGRAFRAAAEEIRALLLEMKEEYGSKIRLAPRLALAMGAFTAVIML